MEQDTDLIREILEVAEKWHDAIISLRDLWVFVLAGRPSEQIPIYPVERITYHIQLCVDNGWLQESIDEERMFMFRLTGQGHSLLASFRESDKLCDDERRPFGYRPVQREDA